MDEKILIVDDDPAICEILEFNLRHEGFDVEVVHSAEEARALSVSQFSVILLDVMMGGMSGYKYAQLLRDEDIHTPIIFLTAKDTENDMLTGFSVGGDDYISKPFSVKEVIARTRAIIRRVHTDSSPLEDVDKSMTYGGLTISPLSKEVTIDGSDVSLTKTEFELLSHLCKHPGRIFSRQDLIETIWVGTPYITERTVDVHITRLRKKLGDYAVALTNRSGYGYRFDPSKLSDSSSCD